MCTYEHIWQHTLILLDMRSIYRFILLHMPLSLSYDVTLLWCHSHMMSLSYDVTLIGCHSHKICHFLSLSHSFLDGYCSSVQSLLDLFEADLGFTKLWFIQTDLCVVCVFVLYSLAFSCPLWTRGEWEFSFKHLKQIFDSTHEDEGMWRSMLHVCVTTGSTWVRDTSFMCVWQQACGAVCFMCVWQQSLSVCSSSPPSASSTADEQTLYSATVLIKKSRRWVHW